MSKRILSLLVFSDLHTVIEDRFSDDSYLIYKDNKSEFADAFLAHLMRLKIDFDAIICAGDLANKSEDGSFKTAWEELNLIKKKLGIQDLFCVPGNHDHDSREKSGVFDPKHRIQFIQPPFPCDDLPTATHFWAWHWCHIEREKCNVILINTSAFHGYGKEYQHGRISTQASDQISDYVKSSKFPEKSINLIVCHHHPIKMEHVDVDYDIEAMDGGQYLLNKLEETNKGSWMVFHGHKHFPEIRLAPATSSEGITILSAGSLSARLHEKINERTSNQFYIVKIDMDKTENMGRAVGKFETYEWTVLDGWHRSKSEKLPAKGGFGSIYTPTYVAKQISKKLDEDGANFLDTSDLQQFEEMIEHMPPIDRKKLKDRLTDLGLKTIFEDNELMQVGK